jgi:hypothetical protein
MSDSTCLPSKYPRSWNRDYEGLSTNCRIKWRPSFPTRQRSWERTLWLPRLESILRRQPQFLVPHLHEQITHSGRSSLGTGITSPRAPNGSAVVVFPILPDRRIVWTPWIALKREIPGSTNRGPPPLRPVPRAGCGQGRLGKRRSHIRPPGLRSTTPRRYLADPKDAAGRAVVDRGGESRPVLALDRDTQQAPVPGRGRVKELVPEPAPAAPLVMCGGAPVAQALHFFSFLRRTASDCSAVCRATRRARARISSSIPALPGEEV